MAFRIPRVDGEETAGRSRSRSRQRDFTFSPSSDLRQRETNGSETLRTTSTRDHLLQTSVDDGDEHS